MDNIDVDDSDEGDSNYSLEGKAVQLMHQTVKDIVRAPDSKRIIFGSRSAQIVENEHTFLARTYLFDLQPVGTVDYPHSSLLGKPEQPKRRLRKANIHFFGTADRLIL